MEQDYHSAFGLCVTYTRDILWKMYHALGWKGTSVPFDFTGFSGYWPEITPERVKIHHGEEIIGTFFPREGGSLGFESYGEELAWSKGFGSWDVMDDFRRGYLFGTLENIQLAKVELQDRLSQQTDNDIGVQQAQLPSRGMKR